MACPSNEQFPNTYDLNAFDLFDFLKRSWGDDPEAHKDNGFWFAGALGPHLKHEAKAISAFLFCVNEMGGNMASAHDPLKLIVDARKEDCCRAVMALLPDEEQLISPPLLQRAEGTNRLYPMRSMRADVTDFLERTWRSLERHLYSDERMFDILLHVDMLHVDNQRRSQISTAYVSATSPMIRNPGAQISVDGKVADDHDTYASMGTRDGSVVTIRPRTAVRGWKQGTPHSNRVKRCLRLIRAFVEYLLFMYMARTPHGTTTKRLGPPFVSGSPAKRHKGEETSPLRSTE